MKRRSLLGAMLAACAAPAYVKAGILMPVKKVWTPTWTGVDLGAGDDLTAFGAWRSEPYVLLVHPDAYRELFLTALRTGEATMYHGEVYSYGVKIVPAETLA